MKGTTEIKVRVGPELFRFESEQHWISKARGWFRRVRGSHGIGPEDFICVDAKGRVCRYGKHFARAGEENAYPIVVYAADELSTPPPTVE